MPNYLDFLLALDAHLRDTPSGTVHTGYAMHEIARDAALVPFGDTTAAGWVGRLVDDGLLTHHADPREPPPFPGAFWSDSDLQRQTYYRLTPLGLDAARSERRHRRELRADAALGAAAPLLSAPWLDQDQQGALTKQATSIREALTGGRWSDALGGAKNLIESAAKITIERRGLADPGARASVVVLVKSACHGEDADIARRLAATADAINEARNASDAGHGRTAPSSVTEAEARLAVTAATAVAEYVLSLG